MRSILFITKLFPPVIGGGIRRIEALYNIFYQSPSLSVDLVTAVKPDPARYPNVQYVKQLLFTDKTIRSSPSFILAKTRLKFFDKALLGWLPNVLKTVVKKEYQFVFATTPVFTNVLIGYIYKIAKRSKPKLIVDYRDFHSFDPETFDTIVKKIIKMIEIHILRQCYRIIVTTASMKRILKAYVDEKKIILIRNYISKADMTLVDNLCPLKFNDHFYHIGYVGNLNTGRDPRKLLTLVTYRIEGRSIILHFVGTNKIEEQYITKASDEIGISTEKIVFHGTVNRLESLRYMKSFNAGALLINGNARIDQGYGIPGKLYDYVYVNNNIISDKETFSNLKTEFSLNLIEEIGEYKRFSLPQFPTLDDSIIRFIQNEL